MPTYEPHHAERLEQLKGAPLASFQARAAAFVLDFFAAFLLFLAVIMLGARLLSYFNFQSLSRRRRLQS